LLFIFLFHDQSPISYYIYAAFPIGFWTYIFTYGMPALRYAADYVRGSTEQRVDIVTVFGGCLAAAQILVFSFFRRETISIIFAVLALWGLFMWGGSKGVSFRLRAVWAGISLALSIFPVVPISMGESYLLVYVFRHPGSLPATIFLICIVFTAAEVAYWLFYVVYWPLSICQLFSHQTRCHRKNDRKEQSSALLPRPCHLVLSPLAESSSLSTLSLP
jgi:hypothetical protein